MSESAPARRSSLSWIRDPRVLLGALVTAFTLWLSFRDLDFGGLFEAMKSANPWILILPSVPAYWLSIWVRALRWRHLIENVATIDRGPLFRATAIGFMVNNVFPFRAGEVLRPWYLSRETGVPATALFGTVIVERVIDMVFVLVLAALLLGTQRIGSLDPVAVLAPLAMIVSIPVVKLSMPYPCMTASERSKTHSAATEPIT